MSPSTNPDEPPQAAGACRILEVRIEALERHIADLHRVVAERTDRVGGVDRRIAVRRPASRPCPCNSNGSPIDSTARSGASAKIASLVKGTRALRLLCIALKEIDDPYGMGASLDERLGLDEATSERDDEWNAS